MNISVRLVIGILGFGLLNSGCTAESDLRRTRTGTLLVSGHFLFSKTMPGSSQSRTVVLTNIGSATVSLTDFRLLAENQFDTSWRRLSRDGKVVNADRHRLPSVITIEPQEALRISLRFAPNQAQLPLGRLDFRTSSGLSRQRHMSLAMSPIGTTDNVTKSHELSVLILGGKRTQCSPRHG